MQSHGILLLQTGSNKYASQQGMNLGTQWHGCDVKVENMDITVHGYGPSSVKLASQQGMSIGSQRHVADIQVEEMSKASATTIPSQAGKTNNHIDFWHSIDLMRRLKTAFCIPACLFQVQLVSLHKRE